jgi:Tfp pilus assembly protein FimT
MLELCIMVVLLIMALFGAPLLAWWKGDRGK